MKYPSHSQRNQLGQAMVELIVVSGVMVALFLFIWYLGKFQDIQASAIQAARYAAWERTVHKPSAMSDATLQAQTRGRLFAWNTDAYKSTDGKGMTDSGSWKTQSGMWLDHTGSIQLLDRPRDVTISTASGPLPGGPAMKLALKTITGVGKVGGMITGGEQLNPDGFYQSQVSVRLIDINSLSAPLNQLPLDQPRLTLNEKHAVATDSWDASGPKQVAMVTRSYTPTAVFAKIDPYLAPVKWALSVFEPSFNDFHPGQICPDIVPIDRVRGRENLKAYNGGGSCF
ncbi:TadE family protein [Collimonas humicola]|uniref:TadE family protein n=1 Tax=Collimonas humicola TaxID=2825886 RepID=UPI001B8D153C|nr:hypothetical protein [Collimonas humicola]